MEIGLAWRDWLDSLDTTGGHIVVLLVIGTGCVIATQYGVKGLDGIMHEAFGALLLACKGVAKNLEVRNGLDRVKRMVTGAQEETADAGKPGGGGEG